VAWCADEDEGSGVGRRKVMTGSTMAYGLSQTMTELVQNAQEAGFTMRLWKIAGTLPSKSDSHLGSA
jgi:hypothetical protein